jgi:hypothetical protein
MQQIKSTGEKEETRELVINAFFWAESPWKVAVLLIDPFWVFSVILL